jgi:nicotinic acid mononucleotide adenylyltransferase
MTKQYKGVIFQSGAFNPIHRQHMKIADDAIAKFPDHKHLMTLSSDTCDKGIIPESELLRRAELIKSHNYDVLIKKSGMFIEDIKTIRNTDELKDLQIVFACGEDTIYRFFRDWEEYYTEHSEYPEERYDDYKKHFTNVLWYVTRRNCPEKEKYETVAAKYFAHHNNIIWSTLEPDNISSTAIRNKEQEREFDFRFKAASLAFGSGWDAVRKLVDLVPLDVLKREYPHLNNEEE